MTSIDHIGRVLVPVHDQDAAIAYYEEKLGFSKTSDIPFGENDRWVEMTPPDGGAAVALVPPQGDYQPGRNTGIGLTTNDARALRDELKAKGVDVDAELMGGEGPVPPLFFFRDLDRNVFLMAESE